MGSERQKQSESLLSRHVNWSEVFDAMNIGAGSVSVVSVLESLARGQIDVAAGKSILSLVIMSPGFVQHISEDIAKRKKSSE